MKSNDKNNFLSFFSFFGDNMSYFRDKGSKYAELLSRGGIRFGCMEMGDAMKCEAFDKVLGKISLDFLYDHTRDVVLVSGEVEKAITYVMPRYEDVETIIRVLNSKINPPTGVKFLFPSLYTKSKSIIAGELRSDEDFEELGRAIRRLKDAKVEVEVRRTRIRTRI